MNAQRIILSLWAFFFLSVMLPNSSPAQITFERTYGESLWDGGFSAQQTLDGGYIIVGYTESFPTSREVYLIKTDSLGDSLWTKTYGGSSADQAYSVQQTSDGGYIIVGSTSSFGSGGRDVYLLKTNISGDTIWSKTFGGSETDRGWSVQQTSDGGYIIVGETSSFGAGTYDVYLIKTSFSGIPLWTRTYGDTLFEYGWAVQQTSDGGYIIVGDTYSFGAGEYDVYLIKTDSSGDTLWTRSYGSSQSDYGRFVQQTSDGGYIIAGYTNTGVSGEDTYLIKTDSLGDTLWTRSFGGSNADYSRSVHQTSDGGFIVTGYTYSFGAGLIDIYLIKTNSLGDTLWTKTYGGVNDDKGYSVKQTSDGGYMIGGHTYSSGAGWADVYLIKTDSLGNVQVGVKEEKSVVSDRFSVFRLYQNQPNPFNKLTAINYQLKAPNHVSLNIYDITGRLVEVLVNEHQEPEIFQVQWEGKDRTSGVYF
jgi:hypothetical protein